MPLYSWSCTRCQKKTEVIRPIAEYQEPPRAEDGIGLEYCEHDERAGVSAHTWERYIPAGSGTFRLLGHGWAKDGYR